MPTLPIDGQTILFQVAIIADIYHGLSGIGFHSGDVNILPAQSEKQVDLGRLDSF